MLFRSSIQIEGEDEHELDEIIDSRLHYNKLQYRAKWKGYGPEENQVWYPANNFNNATLAIKPFYVRYPGKPRIATHHNQQVILHTCDRQGGTRVTHPRRVSQRPICRSQRYTHSSVIYLAKGKRGASEEKR